MCIRDRSVDQVEIDRAETDGPGGIVDFRDGLDGLHAIDGPLDIVVEVLDAQADAVETQRRQQLQDAAIRAARIDFDRIVPGLGIRELEVAVDSCLLYTSRCV